MKDNLKIILDFLGTRLPLSFLQARFHLVQQTNNGKVLGMILN